jgi:hypothetical protein
MSFVIIPASFVVVVVVVVVFCTEIKLVQINMLKLS